MSWRPENWESYYDVVRRGDIVPLDCGIAYEAGADVMYEVAYRKGQRDLVERYKRECESSYKKYHAYWDNLLEEVEDETQKHNKG